MRGEKTVNFRGKVTMWSGWLVICNKNSPMANKEVRAVIYGAHSGVFGKYLCAKSNYEYTGDRYIAFSVAISWLSHNVPFYLSSIPLSYSTTPSSPLPFILLHPLFFICIFPSLFGLVSFSLFHAFSSWKISKKIDGGKRCRKSGKWNKGTFFQLYVVFLHVQNVRNVGCFRHLLHFALCFFFLAVFESS